MLTQVRLRNFKAFGESLQTIKLGKLNVFIGENGTGKSSILQALALLGQSAGQNQLRSEWNRLQFSDYHELVHAMQHGRAMTLGFAYHIPSDSKRDRVASVNYAATFGDAGRVVEQEGQIHVETWPMLPAQSTWTSQYKYGDRRVDPPRIGTSGNFIKFTTGDSICNPFVRAEGAGSGPEHRDLEEAVNLLFGSFSRAVQNVFNVKALRGFDRLSYSLGDAANERPFEANEVINTFAYRRDLEAKISAWLEKVTGVAIDVHLVPQKAAALYSADGYNIYHEGFGTNQLVWPFLQMAISPKHSSVAIEEPEIHLHPKAQALLTEVLVEIAMQEEKQLLITTHSEHILMALLNLVAGEKVRPEDLSVYWFEKDKATKAAIAVPLHVNERGQLEEGLKGFFEASADQLSKYLHALSKKTVKAK